MQAVVPYKKKRTYVSKNKYSKAALAKRYGSGANKLGASRTIHQRWLDRSPPAAVLLTRGPSPFPPKLWTTLTYSDALTLTVAVGQPAKHTFCANGLYDPNITGTGHQPRYFDTLCGAGSSAAPYYKYVVRAARCRATFQLSGPDAVGIVSDVFITRRLDTTSTPSTVTEVRERTADTKFKSVGLYYGGKPIADVYQTADMCAMFGAKDILDYELGQATYAANPGSQIYFDVGVAPWDGTTSPTCRVIIQMEFDCCFFQLNDVNDS